MPAGACTRTAAISGLPEIGNLYMRKSAISYCVISVHRGYPAIGAAQHGHRGRYLTSSAIRRRRMVAIEFGMCRSGRKGGASGSGTSGNGTWREEHGGGRSWGGNRLPLGDQESVGCDAQRRMVMEAAPSAPFIVPQSDLLLKF